MLYYKHTMPMDAPNSSTRHQVENDAEKITKQARGILEYGNNCWINGFLTGFSFACLVPLVACLSMKVHYRITRI